MEQEERGQLTATKSGSKTKSTTELHAEIHRLRRQLERTEEKLKKTELIVEIQKKLSLILGLDLPEIDEKNLGKYSQSMEKNSAQRPCARPWECPDPPCIVRSSRKVR